jgi:DNA (cytosine-5)-methyltransferase 1
MTCKNPHITHASLCTGVGGFDLAAEWMGWSNVFMVEKDPYCQSTLVENFNTNLYDDVFTFDGTAYRGRVSVLSAGFPCQPYSVAGKQFGADDDRAIWPQVFRVVREVQPTIFIGENVTGIIGLALEQVCLDLESEGYAVQTFVVPACAVDALHPRERVWIVAYADGKRAWHYPAARGQEGSTCYPQQSTIVRPTNRSASANRTTASIADNVTYPDSQRQSQCNRCIADFGRWVSDCAPQNVAYTDGFRWQHGKQADRLAHILGWREYRPLWQPADTADLLRAAYGLPRGLDGTGEVPSSAQKAQKGSTHRVKAMGNAVVPQVVFEFFKAIKSTFFD